MKAIFDPQTDSMSLIFREDEIVDSDELREGIIIDYIKDGKIVSMEIFDASEQITEPERVFYELKDKDILSA